VVRYRRRIRTEFGIGICRARWPRLLAAIACFAVWLASGCRTGIERQPAVAVECGISPQPVRVGPAILNVKLHDAAGQPVAGARVDLEADMSHPGMAPVFAPAREGAPGQYQGSLPLAMPGDWVMLIHVTLPDGRKLDRQLSVPGVSAN
jgi:hypothetical protein